MTDLQSSSSGPDLALLRLWLESRYAETVQEIRGYPAPIPACDQHYNHLLARRRGYAQALRSLDQASPADADPAAALGGLIDFLRTAVSLSDSEARALADHVTR
jgi:hypothetical protein